MKNHYVSNDNVLLDKPKQLLKNVITTVLFESGRHSGGEHMY